MGLIDGTFNDIFYFFIYFEEYFSLMLIFLDFSLTFSLLMDDIPIELSMNECVFFCHVLVIGACSYIYRTLSHYRS